MKTTLKLLAISCVCMLAMGACGNASNYSDSPSTPSNSKETTNRHGDNYSKTSEDQEYDEVSEFFKGLKDVFSPSNPSNSNETKNEYGDNYEKACEEIDFFEAHQIVKNLKNEALKHGIDRWSIDDGYYSKYEVADIFVFNEEASYLLSLDDPSSEKRILKLILETSIDGAPISEGQCKYGVAYDILESAGEAGAYARGLSRFNRKCDITMDLAIMFKNQSLAKSVLALYKDELHAALGDNYSGRKEAVANVRGKKIMIGDQGYAWYESNSKVAAQKKYNEAVKIGAFE